MARAFDLSHVICLCHTAQKVPLLKVLLSFLLNGQFALPSFVCTVSGVEACCPQVPTLSRRLKDWTLGCRPDFHFEKVRQEIVDVCAIT